MKTEKFYVWQAGSSGWGVTAYCGPECRPFTTDTYGFMHASVSAAVSWAESRGLLFNGLVAGN